MYTKIKQKIYNLIRDDDKNTLSGNIFDGVIIALILLNVLFVIIDTFSTPSWYTMLAQIVEIVSVAVFTVEYLLRLLTADLKYPERGWFFSRIRYIFSFMAIIDLLAILPFYLPMALSVDLRVLRAFRLFRLLRILKFTRYTSAMRMIGNVLKRKRHQLASSMIVIFVLMIISSVLMYSVEHDSQPGVFQNAFSGLWWSVATFTTVGYGDIFPITVVGKILSAVIALLGIGIVAIPTGIISAGFIEMTDEEKKEKRDEKEDAVSEDETKHEGDEKKYCPYCGHKYEK